jgi:hypothetical protein
VGNYYKTVLKGRLGIYDETHPDNSSFQVNIAPQEDPQPNAATGLLFSHPLSGAAELSARLVYLMGHHGGLG